MTRASAVKRWVCRRRDTGTFATDTNCEYFDRDLAAAYVFVGKPDKTAALEPVEVVVMLAGAAAVSGYK